MVKTDIIRSIEVQLGLSHGDATTQVEQILTILKDHLAEGDPVLISGFGQWKVRNKPARIGRNPKTLEEFEVTPRRVVTFYPSNVWREEISNNSTPKQAGESESISGVRSCAWPKIVCGEIFAMDRHPALPILPSSSFQTIPRPSALV